MAKNKTIETENSVADFLTTITDEKKRTDCSTIIDLITEQTGLEPKMWGSSIVGFGSYHYIYDSGRMGDAPLVGIAARSFAQQRPKTGTYQLFGAASADGLR